MANKRLCKSNHFYPHPPRGGRRTHQRLLAAVLAISIHTLREEGDILVPNIFPTQFMISIHTLREEGDLVAHLGQLQRRYFYPHPPRGGRRKYIAAIELTDAISIHTLREEGDLNAIFTRLATNTFLSTPSARRATATVKDLALELVISIHTLREEGDRGTH